MATEPPQTKAAMQKAAAPTPDSLAVLYGEATVVVARSDSLQPLQALCHAEDETVPTVMTARYRLRSGPVFGNLLAAFVADMRQLLLGAGAEPRGDLLPEHGPSSPWATLVNIDVWDDLAPGPAWVEALVAVLGDPTLLPSHRRLLLFCEVEEDAGDLDEWRQAVAALSPLPRNVTLVVSDAPRGWDGPEIDPPQGEAAGEEVFTFVEAALSGDQPADVDRLGVAPLAGGLARLLLLPQTRPLTVGVQAPWGWGKSSFVAFVHEALIRHAATNRDTAEVRRLEEIERELAGLERGELPDAELAAQRADQDDERARLLALLEERAHVDVIGISFNAWRYEGSEQVWAGLARAITDGLESTLSRPARLRSRIAYAIRRRRVDFWVGFVAPVVLALVVALLAILLGLADAGDELSGWSGALAGVLAPVAAVVLITWRFLHVIQPMGEQVAGYVQGPDHAAHMGYQNEVIDDLKFLRGRVAGNPRVVVFVDDLDRCGDESIMETLQAINLVLGASDFFVVLAIDPEMIHRAIARQRGIADDDVAADAFAQNYLRKIIQLPLILPGRTADQRFGFVSQLFSPAAQREFLAARENGAAPQATAVEGEGRTPFAFDPAAVVPPRVQVLREVQDTKDELEALQAFREFLDDNPRELKRLVNVHRLVKILLQRPDAPPTVEQQRKLVAWLVFCARSPALVDDALTHAAEDPDAVLEFGTAHFTARDLAPDGTLDRAARISLLVRDRPDATRPQPAAASDPAAPPAASPS